MKAMNGKRKMCCDGLERGYGGGNIKEMTHETLLATLKKRNITLELKGNKIAIKGMLTDELREAIRACKPALIKYLRDARVIKSCYEKLVGM